MAVVNGYSNSIQQIVNELQFNPNKANGTLKEITVNVQLNSTTDLISQFSRVLIHIDNLLGRVDGNGLCTALQNGVAKVTAYNEKGIVDIIVKVSNEQ